MQAMGIVGTTCRRRGQAGLRGYLLGSEQLPAGLCALHRTCGFKESVYLSTCNRVEVIFVHPPGVSVSTCRQRVYGFFQTVLGALPGGLPPCSPSEEADLSCKASRALHAYEGEGAVEYLFAIAASLDSMNPGEAQILGQVKQAFQMSAKLGLVGSQLRWVFEEAFQAAKRVRRQTQVGCGGVSLVSLVARSVQARLEAGQGRLGVVGVGDMAHQCGGMFGKRALKEGRRTSLLFVNRSVGRAQALACRYGGQAMALADFIQDPPAMDVMVTATSAPEPLFGEAFFQKVQAPAPWIVDMAVRGDVDIKAAAQAQISVCTLDDLQALTQHHRYERQRHMVAARMVLDEALEAFQRRITARQIGSVVRWIRQTHQKTVASGLEDLLTIASGPISGSTSGPIPGSILGSGALPQRWDRWAQSLSNRLAHGLTVGLKQLALKHGPSAVDAFWEGVKGSMP